MVGNRIRITGQPGEVYVLEATTDFEEWGKVAVLKNETGFVDFVDSQVSKLEKRFYRFRVHGEGQSK